MHVITLPSAGRKQTAEMMSVSTNQAGKPRDSQSLERRTRKTVPWPQTALKPALNQPNKLQKQKLERSNCLPVTAFPKSSGLWPGICKHAASSKAKFTLAG